MEDSPKAQAIQALGETLLLLFVQLGSAFALREELVVDLPKG